MRCNISLDMAGFISIPANRDSDIVVVHVFTFKPVPRVSKSRDFCYSATIYFCQNIADDKIIIIFGDTALQVSQFEVIKQRRKKEKMLKVLRKI